MGAKIQFAYLSNADMKNILLELTQVLFEFGANYNGTIQGEYTYWAGSPICNYGASNTIKENNKRTYKKPSEMEDILNEICLNYSPSITFGFELFERDVALILSIFEGEGNWKEVKLSIDRYGAYDLLNEIEKKTALVLFQDLFSKIALNLKPYYGICATELMGMVSSPEQLIINKDMMGDFNYFCSDLLNQIDFKSYENDFSIKRIAGQGAILVQKHGLFCLA